MCGEEVEIGTWEVVSVSRPGSYDDEDWEVSWALACASVLNSLF